MDSVAVRALIMGLLVLPGSCTGTRSVENVGAFEASTSSRQMPDGKWWTTENLNLAVAESYCYAGSELNCRQYGRLYSWESAQRVCRSLGGRWRLPSNDDWRQLARHYGGIRAESADTGKAAYQALVMGGASGFDALLGGGRAPDSDEYARLDAHGFYWTASETGPETAWFYNFGKGQLSLGHHDDGEKQRAFSVRCVSE
jgi:uncharacterized protein (TIGR02145 family)